MKTRNGFVSNSSSSSFVILTARSDFDRILKNQHDDVRALVEGLRNAKAVVEDVRAFGQDMVKFGFQSGNSSTFEYGGAEDILRDVAEKRDIAEQWGLVEELDAFRERLVEEIPEEHIFYSTEDF